MGDTRPQGLVRVTKLVYIQKDLNTTGRALGETQTSRASPTFRAFYEKVSIRRIVEIVHRHCLSGREGNPSGARRHQATALRR